ncbi:nucleotidyltransferase family protein [Proteobacteria bacterium 005FR1]|nr:nucleotidyltransferase family protein [Proteobacteria bacterium 005FR1]
MKALIFAAGRGERMAELTRHTPKPLLVAGGKPLIQYTVERLRAGGVTELLVNIAYLGEQIRDFLGDGERFGVNVIYSQEPYPLETGGAILRALPLLGDAPFITVNADVWTDFDFTQLHRRRPEPDELGHLVMVPNPAHVPGGDFYLNESGRLQSDNEAASAVRLTYSGIAVLHPQLVASYPKRREIFPLAEAFRWAMAAGRLNGEVFTGQWRDIGTPQRLRELEEEISR